MTKIAPKIQSPNEAVDITNWPLEEEYGGVYAKGAREKSIVFCPKVTNYSFLIPDNGYIFKQSFHRYPEQYWMEIFAYRLACLMGVPVPPAFVAYDTHQKICGALIEWVEEGILEGGNFMRLLIKNYDLKKGEQHNFQQVMQAAQLLEIKNATQAWAKIFTFDAIIGNTDRHHDNWGVTLALSALITPQAYFSPAFDNGTSMGHEIIEKNFKKFEKDNKLKKYVENGRHHMKWSYPEERTYNHAEFIKKFLENLPEEKENILSCLEFSIKDVKNILKELTEFKVMTPLTDKRAALMLSLVEYRKNWLYDTINSI